MWTAGPTAALSLAVAALATLFAFVLLVRARGRGFHAAIGACLAISGMAHTARALGLRHALPDTFLLCLGLVIQLLAPAGLFWVGAVVLGAPGSAPRARARLRALVVLAVCGLCAALAWTTTTLEVGLSPKGAPFVALGPLGRIVFGVHVVLLALGIAQFEALLRAAPHPLRYSLKLVLPALALPAVYQIYSSSQILLVGTAPLDRSLPVVLLMSATILLLALGLWVERAAPKAPVYVAPRIVFGSVTFLVIGLYLLSVGAVGQLIRQSWSGVGPGLSEALVLLGLLGLSVALLSRTFQAEMRLFVTRYFHLSKYDYREKWLEITDAFESCRTVDSILDRLLDVVARTFDSGRIAVWMQFEADDRFHQVRSTNLEVSPLPLPARHALVRALHETDAPLDLDLPQAGEGAAALSSFREATGAVLCAPLTPHGSLVGFVTLGRERGGEAYAADDRNLLRAITHHAGGLLSNARLSEERRGAAELEALHRVSAFCVHDLKNLAATLSLVAKNAETHGSDPEFQRNALDSVGRTAGKIMDLVQRLRRSPEASPLASSVDLNEAIRETLASLHEGLRAAVRLQTLPVPRVMVPQEDLHQLVLNLVLNAVEALEPRREQGLREGDILVRTEGNGEAVHLTVTDQGPGLSSAQLFTLFQPFKTGKTGGLGLGLYECKRIADSHGGRIWVESEVGRGTAFHVELPAFRQLSDNDPAGPAPRVYE